MRFLFSFQIQFFHIHPKLKYGDSMRKCLLSFLFRSQKEPISLLGILKKVHFSFFQMIQAYILVMILYSCKIQIFFLCHWFLLNQKELQ